MRPMFRRVASTALVGALLIGGGAGVAQAATCNSGFACFFADLSYGGAMVQREARSGNLVGNALNNKATSIATNGKSCYATRFYDAADLKGSYLLLHSEQRKGKNYRDPDLRNGGGIGPEKWRTWNYDDRISGWKFTGC